MSCQGGHELRISENTLQESFREFLESGVERLRYIARSRRWRCRYRQELFHCPIIFVLPQVFAIQRQARVAEAELFA